MFVEGAGDCLQGGQSAYRGEAAASFPLQVPIVFGMAGDPVELGLVASLNRPGANVTGIAVLETELTPKRLQLLRELLPNAARFGILADPAEITPSTIADLQAAARTLGLQIVVVKARTDGDLELAFASFSQQHVGAVLATTLSAGFRMRSICAGRASNASHFSRLNSCRSRSAFCFARLPILFSPPRLWLTWWRIGASGGFRRPQRQSNHSRS
jgi:ABC transporter substrate binding protein